MAILKNVYGQFHSWFQAVGVFILGAIVTYLLNTASNEWTWQGIVVSACGAVATYGFTADDHKKTRQAASSIAAQTGDGSVKQPDNGGA